MSLTLMARAHLAALARRHDHVAEALLSILHASATLSEEDETSHTRTLTIQVADFLGSPKKGEHLIYIMAMGEELDDMVVGAKGTSLYADSLSLSSNGYEVMLYAKTDNDGKLECTITPSGAGDVLLSISIDGGQSATTSASFTAGSEGGGGPT